MNRNVIIANAFSRRLSARELAQFYLRSADRGVKPDNPQAIPQDRVYSGLAAIHENKGANFVLTVNGQQIASSTHPEPLLQFVRTNGLTLVQPIPAETVKSSEPFAFVITEPDAFSPEADALLQKSFELDDNAKPGDTYVDPFWGIVHVPNDNEPSIRDKWNHIVRTRYGGNYAAADSDFPTDEEAKQSEIERRYSA